MEGVASTLDEIMETKVHHVTLFEKLLGKESVPETVPETSSTIHVGLA